MKHENHPVEKENHRPNLHFFNFLGSTLVVASACITVSEMRGTCISSWYFTVKKSSRVDPNDYVGDDMVYHLVS